MAQQLDHERLFPVAVFKHNSVTVKDEEGHIIGSSLEALSLFGVEPPALPNKKTTPDVKGTAHVGVLVYKNLDHVGTLVFKRIACEKGEVFDDKKHLTAIVKRFGVTITEDGTTKEAGFIPIKHVEKEEDK